MYLIEVLSTYSVSSIDAIYSTKNDLMLSFYVLPLQIREADIIDQFCLERTTESVYYFDRIQLLEVGETTKKGNSKIVLYRKRGLQLDKEDYREEFS